MSLSDLFSISTRQQRATRIDSDLNSDFFHSFVYHGSAQTVLEALLRQYAQAGQKTYTLTGPYGSGKSTIALLIAGLLHSSNAIRSEALKVITGDSHELLNESIPYKHGWIQIISVGGIYNPIASFWNATLKALKEHPRTNLLYEKYIKVAMPDDSELVLLWQEIFHEANDLVDGILIVADEMGKSLEFISKNKGELHFFQDLAEIISRVNTPIIFFGLLHQAFSEYAKNHGNKLQEEWGKIQGRYHDITYNVSTDETVSLISKSIISHTKKPDIEEDDCVRNVLAAINDTQDRKKLLYKRLANCTPLHPLTALLLGPISKRRFSQNERSTFSFLNSHEKHSFQLFLKNTNELKSRYDLVNLWDYLETNLEHSILSSPDAHGWATAAESIRLAIQKGLPNQAIEILKTISLITLFGKPANLTATRELILSATNISPTEVDKHLVSLKEKSCIIYRKHLSSWMVFEGSDLDLASLIDDKIEQLLNSDEAIEHINFTGQVIAKGHYHTSGTLRWVDKKVFNRLSDIKNKKHTSNGAFSSFYLLLTDETENKIKDFSSNNKDIIIALAKNSQDIKSLALENYALELIKSEKEIGRIIQHDKIARREYEGRRSNSEIILTSAIEDGFSNADWYYNGSLQTSSSLSKIATYSADHIFSKTPNIKNELVNRNKLSGTAVSALKKLLEAMINNEHEENLGISGFPPEKSIYISCLKETNIHSSVAFDGKHWFIDNLNPKFDAIFSVAISLLKKNIGQQVKLSEIVDLWSKPPYGLTLGVIPIFLLAFMKSLNQKIAFYEQDLSGNYAFILEPDVDYVHKTIRNQGELAVKYISHDEEDRKWLQHLAVFAASETNKDVSNNILSIATTLVTTIHNLPQWVKNSHNFIEHDFNKNKKILSLRDLFLNANDPHNLLILELPKLIDPFNSMSLYEKIDVLFETFKVLRERHELMLNSIKMKVKSIFPETGSELETMCAFVESKSGDIRLKAFARELAKSDTGLTQWLENMIQIVVGRGKQNWNEGLLLTASTKISDFSQDFLSVIKSHSLSSESLQMGPKTRMVSLVLESSDGKLQTFKKEILLAEENKIFPARNAIQEMLENLNEFEKISVLQQILKETLEGKG